MSALKVKTADRNMNVLCMALINHSRLLQSGLTPYEAQCATFTSDVVQALDESTPRVQENFGLYIQYQVEQNQGSGLATPNPLENKVLSMSEHISKKDQQHRLGWHVNVIPREKLLRSSN